MKRPKKITIILSVLLLAAGAGFLLFLQGYDFFTLVLSAAAVALFLLDVLPKKGKAVLLALIIAFLSVFSIFEQKVIKASRGSADAGSADYLIVFGAAVHGNLPSPSLTERLNAALKYLNENPKTAVIVSGGKGKNEDLSEAAAMASWLKRKGIAEERIIEEADSASTEENLQNSMDLIGENNADKKIALCSSEYHLYRASFLFEKKFRMKYETVPAKTRRPLLRLCYFMREACAMILIVAKS